MCCFENWPGYLDVVKEAMDKHQKVFASLDWGNKDRLVANVRAFAYNGETGLVVKVHKF